MGRKKKQKQKEFQTPRGMHDILPEDQKYYERIRSVLRTLFSYYGFGRIDTPILEDTDLFLHGVGHSTDIVEKEMYSFKTEGGDALTLRPEGTAAVARAYTEHGMFTRPQPVKLYYEGPFFRHEAPQRGRYRQFHQIGLELIGEEGAVADAEIMHVVWLLFKELGIKDLMYHVNSVGCQSCRPAYRSALVSYYRNRAKGLCRNCKRRFKLNPLRLLDCKEEKCVMVKKSAPQILDHVCESCKKHFTLLLEFLDEDGISYTLNPHLVRGLDYYTKTAFEILTDPSAPSKKEAPKVVAGVSGDVAPEGEKKEPIAEAEPLPRALELGGGGRYDGLTELLGGKQTPAVGVAVGVERIIEVMKMQQVRVPERAKPRVFFVQLGDLAKKKSFKIIEELRSAGISMAESLGKESIKSQLKIADRVEGEYSLILGQKEAIDGTIIIREMSSGIQEVVPFDKLIELLKRKLKK
ncbi:MAG: hypothetical protein A3I44_03910 [Candidatus Sungbacteria bacterium RIFCSPLOWO2_02_FULL_51_17]|uniref:Histidine--tRNA ligase n=1 Tax=Candidatus Sungbacteria bacterium RIFCSPHIGHO2_02_FULL_51_29 TaxID=1802273 RepID=A0A1G2KUE6_9BACT|nr:MAG: hypothetical protein A2676_02430 [Candidatus Sungbacteria bacterium RIFCSPHIGHO2_01_FULL_51_22]OHA02252.1 MAG: hypothetical protein A3C16_04100 [Candidatus Sungbacteria bacterium RIFCSPHIGHO2_02_FULL_51_29]OHA06663.1 MAG: hypothetical protein A3B29_03075 [Candidatus Sungbacteria bacterium RIFCSPLOWO2_01_FULL_51_34]OHA11231.1 MAG: hypothetical protein A3I44_03910 [Candidatus Sungbacteria bacterium RIFCSPLOWO2_02_FULL_51_17]